MKALEFDNVSFAYADRRPVLKDASFEIEEGEFVALVGKNGSGKSTIAKLADAFLLPNDGSVKVFGEDTKEVAKEGNDALLAFRCDIGFVLQNPDDQFVASRVIDEVAFGPCGLGIPREEVLGRVGESLEQVGAMGLAERSVNALSGGQKQRIAIADALAMRPKMFIFDEPTSMLDETGEREIMRIISDLHASGATIVLITHSASEAEHAQRVLQVQDGKIVDAPDMARQEERCFHGVMAKAREIEGHGRDFGGSNAETVLEFDEVCFEYSDEGSLLSDLSEKSPKGHPVFENLDLRVFDGEFICVTGPNGSGKSTLALLMNGLLRPNSGEVRVFSTPTDSKQGANAARRRVGVCFQYPERSLFCQSVLEEVAFGPKNLRYGDQESQMMAKDALAEVGIDAAEILGANPFELSGGMQRKVSIASILSMRPDILVMDEPCAGLDMDAHAELAMMLLDLKAKGQTIVMVTHDKRDVQILADRVIRLR